MPYKPARPCAICGQLTINKDRFCDLHLQRRNQQLDANRGTPAERGYNSRWQQSRPMYLRAHPLCVMCQAEGRIVASTVVDHIRPHRGDYNLMWDTNNWQSLCAMHHSIKTAKQDGAFGNKRETRG